MKISHLKSLLSKQFLLAALATVFSVTAVWAQQDAAAGEKLFDANCASCHAVNEKLTGPALKGVHERREEAWLVNWIKNSSKVIKSGDPYAVKLFNEYQQTQMTSFENLTDAEIKNILAFIKSSGAAAVAVTADPAPGAQTEVVVVPAEEKDGFNWKGFFILAALVFVVIILSQLAETYLLAESLQKKSIMNLPWNKINAAILVLFLIVGMTAAIWETAVHSQYMWGEAASEHGKKIDQMLYTTCVITAIVFFITQILLFWFGFRYQYRSGKKGYYYPHNNKLEYIWTIIPAIALTILVAGGFKTWQGITAPPPAGTPEIEVFAYQFGWTVRYPGADKQLGNANFNFISGKNTMGIALLDEAKELIGTLQEERSEVIATVNKLGSKLDSLTLLQRRFVVDSKDYNDLQKQIERITSGEERSELMLDIRRKETQITRLERMISEENAKNIFTPASFDDIVVKEIHIPVNKPVCLKFRARDVIHSAYMPEFRLQMNAVPGMPTQFWFTPTVTTAEQKKITGNQKFDYYLFCAKICGASHFNMKMKVIVESEEDYNKWLSAQKPYYVAVSKEEAAPAASDSSATTAIKAAEKDLALGN